GLEDGVDDVRTDILTLTATSNSEALQTVTGLDADDIGSFFASPVTINSEPVYEVNSYGSSMAGLFTNLSLWIGAFMLMVVFRVEVDTEGFKRVTVRQAYVGRFILMAIMVALQAIIVTSGNLIIGVQTVNPFAFIGTAILVGLAYLSIIYALASTLGLVGKFVAVLLVIMQIPGASGLYPIELMPGFFKAIYPFLPFPMASTPYVRPSAVSTAPITCNLCPCSRSWPSWPFSWASSCANAWGISMWSLTAKWRKASFSNLKTSRLLAMVTA